MSAAAMTRLKLPPRFWQDHEERADDSWLGEWKVIREAKRYVIVDLDADALANLKSDAEYYSDGVDMDPGPWTNALVASARATVKAIANQTTKETT